MSRANKTAKHQKRKVKLKAYKQKERRMELAQDAFWDKIRKEKEQKKQEEAQSMAACRKRLGIMI